MFFSFFFNLVTFSPSVLRGGLFIPSGGDGLALVSFAESMNILQGGTARVVVRFNASKGALTGNKAVPTRVRVCVCRGRGDAAMHVPVYVLLFVLPPSSPPSLSSALVAADGLWHLGSVADNPAKSGCVDGSARAEDVAWHSLRLGGVTNLSGRGDVPKVLQPGRRRAFHHGDRTSNGQQTGWPKRGVASGSSQIRAKSGAGQATY